MTGLEIVLLVAVILLTSPLWVTMLIAVFALLVVITGAAIEELKTWFKK